MVRITSLLVLALLLPSLPSTRVSDGANYAADGQLEFPKAYREWVFLAAGLDMSYDPKAQQDGMHMFNNVFVNPQAYRAFQATGHWPEGSVLMIENRRGDSAKSHPSLNSHGFTQSAEMMGFEVHVLDSASEDPKHKGDGWAFYEFDNEGHGRLVPRPATCYTCHEQHAAVDTTFVQFYPTLLQSAEQHKTFSKPYLAELK